MLTHSAAAPRGESALAIGSMTWGAADISDQDALRADVCSPGYSYDVNQSCC